MSDARFYCELCESPAIEGDHDCRCCDKVKEYGEGHGHSPDCDNYDGPPDGDAWSGGFAENH